MALFCSACDSLQRATAWPELDELDELELDELELELEDDELLELDELLAILPELELELLDAGLPELELELLDEVPTGPLQASKKLLKPINSIERIMTIS